MNERTNEPKASKYQDVTLLCVDCEQDFIFTAEEQQFFYSKGLATPKRCKPCRKARKDSIVRDGGYNERQ